MSELHCPSCGHHIGNLRTTAGESTVKTDDIEAWMAITSWADYEAPAALYQRYSNWAHAAGRDPLSQRMFSRRIVLLGARVRSVKTGRTYAPPLPV
ncbi:hypothetical protein [Arthrobacter sp. UYCu712]|uniref:hypothetical protein n=1 Tax=Arthrobacter sp. UYCu712 TaxID=3156340 RepID=UPI003391124F